MSKYASKTKVSSEKSKNEIERTLVRYGATEFLYGTKPEWSVIAFKMVGRQIRFMLPLPNRNDPEFTEYRRGCSTWERAPEAAEKLYEELGDAGIEVLFDDREESAAGVKFNDADLLGLPFRLVVSPRNLKAGVVEIKGRTDSEAGSVPLDEVVEAVRRRLAAATE